MRKKLVWLTLIGSNIWLYSRVFHPLRQLATQAKKLSSGDFTALEQNESGIPEIDTLRMAMNAMVGHVRRAQAQERTYIEALTNGQENERARIAHELHDDTVQSLIAIAQSLEIAGGLLDPNSPARDILKLAREQAIESVSNLRRLISNLRPPMLEELGLVPALRMLAEGTHGTQVSIQASGHIRRLNNTKELALFRSAQEAIHNAQRHGQAKHIKVVLDFTPEATRLSIQDDGSGFELPPTRDVLSANGHYGLVGMFERIQSLEGKVELTSTIGHGTQFNIVLPVQDYAQPDDVVRDPVCSAAIQPQEAYASLDYQGQRYYFCCPVCQGAFQTEPEAYLHGNAHHH
jgi:signal transduction histidine kinase/YHS domain-containing protein